MKSPKDTFTLNNGQAIPCIGFGTWKIPQGQTTIDSVVYALNVGYRHLDTAAIYLNEEGVGKGIAESGISRHEIFVTSKVWNSERGYDKTLKAFDNTMKKLRMDYLDLYLIHWPAITSDGDKVNLETWKAMEELVTQGRIKSIGVSNFLVHHLQPLMDGAEIMPAVNQIEFHPGQMQHDVLEFCKKNNILAEAWSPLGRGSTLSNPDLLSIAEKYGKSVAQICLRWCLQNGVLPLSRSVNESRIEENADIFDFEIDSADMKFINSMSYFGGGGVDPDKVDF